MLTLLLKAAAFYAFMVCFGAPGLLLLVAFAIFDASRD